MLTLHDIFTATKGDPPPDLLILFDQSRNHITKDVICGSFDACWDMINQQRFKRHELDDFLMQNCKPPDLAQLIMQSLDVCAQLTEYHDILHRQDAKLAQIWRHEVVLRQLYKYNELCKTVKGSYASNVPFGNIDVVEPMLSDDFMFVYPKTQTVAPSWHMPYARTEPKFFTGPMAVLQNIMHHVNTDKVKMVLAGSAALKAAQGRKPASNVQDLDIFLTGIEETKDAANIARYIIERWGAYGVQYRHVLVSMTTTAISVVNTTPELEDIILQIVLRPYLDIDQVLLEFDLGVCCHAWDGTHFYCSPRSVFSLENGIHVCDPLLKTTGHRTHKYEKRGFRFVIPVWQQQAWKILNRAHGLSSEEIKSECKKGGFRSLAVAAYTTKNTSESSALYNAYENPHILFDPIKRSEFERKHPEYRVFVLKSTYDEECVYPSELHQELTRRKGRWRYTQFNSSTSDQLILDDLKVKNLISA